MTPQVTYGLLAAVAVATLLGCGGASMREGDPQELLDRDGEASGVPLASQAKMVERIATELGPQVDEYRIGANDVLNIVVLGHDELSSPRDFNKGVIGTIVKKDGNIYLPIVGPVPAAGMTVEEFQRQLNETLARYIKEPQLTVDVLRYESQKFFVLGSVSKPGAFPVDGDTTLLEGIGLAGGVTEDGSLEQAYVIRERALLPINLADLLLRGDTSRNVYMRNGDLVFVPSSANLQVYVLGEVVRPGPVKIPQGSLTLGQALAEAGGLLPIEADEGSIKLIRGSWQEPTVYTLDYETVLANGDRIVLAPGDRVVVQPTGLTTASRYMEQILPFLIGADYGTRVYDRWRAW